ncbi:MAG: DUF6134 family protein [Woeseiaceae bacterium]
MATRTLARISAVIACAAFGGAIASYESPSVQWRFDVSLDGKPIGFHTFELQQDGAQKVLVTEASFDVKFLFITAFRYRHENTEIWDNGCLRSLDAATNSNGRELLVRGSVEEDGFSVQNAEGSQALPACVQTFAYWNSAILDSPQLLNSQTGVYEDVSVTPEGPDQVSVGGKSVEAMRYRLSAQAGDIKLWYATSDNTWIGLEAPAKGGRKILYQAIAVPESGVVS